MNCEPIYVLSGRGVIFKLSDELYAFASSVGEGKVRYCFSPGAFLKFAPGFREPTAEDARLISTCEGIMKTTRNIITIGLDEREIPVWE